MIVELWGEDDEAVGRVGEWWAGGYLVNYNINNWKTILGVHILKQYYNDQNNNTFSETTMIKLADDIDSIITSSNVAFHFSEIHGSKCRKNATTMLRQK